MCYTYYRNFNKGDHQMKNINELGLQSQSFIGKLPYLSPYTTKQGTYYKFTGYHANGGTMDDMIPEGYTCIKMFQVWSEIKRTSINVMMIKSK